jgi:hypothetical protein
VAEELTERLVFISHAGEDAWIARQIAREVASRGARPFLDQADIDVGAEFEDEIRLFLDRANELIVLPPGRSNAPMFGQRLGRLGYGGFQSSSSCWG